MPTRPPTRYIETVVATDPDSGLPVELEIRKDPESGTMVGIDGSYLANTDEPIYSPHNRGRTLRVPDDEAGVAIRVVDANAASGP